MTSSPVCDLATLAAAVPEGARLAVPSDQYGVSMAATRELVRRGVRRLRLVCVPIGGLQADVLIGAGAVASIETSAVSLGEFGTAHRFVAALRAGAIEILDSTCPAIHAGLQAAQKGLPFMPLRGLIGSDVLAHRRDWKVIENPFRPDDPIVALPAIAPDVALFHAPRADRFGNVFIGRRRELLTMAHASRATLVTVEEIVDGSLMDDPDRAPGVIPSIYITHVAEAKQGATPMPLPGAYAIDERALARYADAARTPEGFARWLEAWIGGRQADAA